MNRFILFFTGVLLSVSGHSVDAASRSGSESKVLFHPFDETLKEASRVVLSAEQNIDIAMYNMDVSDNSPVIQALKSAAVQEKLHAKTLKIRVVFEGYGTVQDNEARSAVLEGVGVDVRWLKGGKKVHHKFAVVDAGTEDAVVVTGSANWSLSSQRSYDENIMYWHGVPRLVESFQTEFNLLWSLGEEFGATRFPEAHFVAASNGADENVGVTFNSANFKVRNGSLARSPDVEGWEITKALVAEIDRAEQSIDIATTRIVLRPVYNAILRAAERGVRINIVVNQDQYEFISRRVRSSPQHCSSEYDDDCSTSQNFPWFLVSEDYPGRSLVNVRIKFFSLDTRMPLAKQMHSKYLIVDGTRVASGSFNWSVSAEWSHIENLVAFDGSKFPSMLKSYQANHETVYSQGRGQYEAFVKRIEGALGGGVKTDCTFAPMALTFTEIDWLLDTGKRLGKKLSDACE